MSSEKIVSVTDRARNKALSVRDEEPDGDKLALFLEITEPRGMEYGYDLYFDDDTAVREDDVIQDEDGLKIVIPAGSIDNLRGATLDLSKNLLNPGWVVDNPNSPSPAVGAGVGGAEAIDPGELTGSVDERIEQVLAHVINPAIAAHGGRAELARFEDGTAFLRLSGGCQGCGMASVTLTQGIEVTLTEAVPEVQRVADVTDHEAGQDPYFERAKK